MEITCKQGKVPSFEQLITFLTQHCRALETSSPAQRSAASSLSEKSSHSKDSAVHVATTKVTCAYCQKENHGLYRCKEFLALEVAQRIKEAKTRKLCLNCLRSSNHQAKECTVGMCRKCNKRHNTLIHFEQNSREQANGIAVTTESNSEENAKITSVSCTSTNQTQQVLLATATVNILNAKGEPKLVRTLLDNGLQLRILLHYKRLL